MSELSRLSDRNIEDPILRASYYRLVLDYLNSKNAETIAYTIKMDEEFRADLASYRCYSTSELEWLFYLVCETVDPVDGIPVGETLTLPTASWVRRSMRQFMDESGI